MRRWTNSKSIISILMALALIAAFTGGLVLGNSPQSTQAAGLTHGAR